MEERLAELFASMIENQNQTNARLDNITSKLALLEDVPSKLALLEDVPSKLALLEDVPSKLADISSQLIRMESNANQDVIGLLELINTKLDLCASKEDIDFFARKFGQYDLEIDRLKRVK